MKNIKHKFSNFLFISLCIAGLSSCNQEGIATKEALKKAAIKPTTSNTDPANVGNTTINGFEGCVSGQGIDTTRIFIRYNFLTDYPEMFILRDGIEIYSSRDHTRSTFIDTTLQEGQTYTYECGVRNDHGTAAIGSRSLELSTLVNTPPLFSGIQAATASGTKSVTLTWGPTYGGAATDHFNIYYNTGTSINWNLAAKATATFADSFVQVDNLGDEIPYTFGIRACTKSNVCDSNLATRSVTLADTGAPTTPGLAAVSLVNSQITLTVPWSDSQGGVAQRKIYQRIGAVGGTNIADYTLVQTAFIDSVDIGNPATSITLNTTLPATMYHFIVRDEDPSFHLNQNTNVLSIETTDIDPPAFGGITSLAYGTPADSTLSAQFTAINNQPADPNGATYYLVYLTSANYPTVPTDPCADGVPVHAQLNSSNYTPGNASYSITGLQVRKTYRVCMKAKDLANNVSVNTQKYTLITKDITAPIFFGVQFAQYNNALQRVEVDWQASTSSDIKEYKVQIWSSADPGNITTITAPHSSNPNGLNFVDAQFPLVDNSIINVLVNACDDAFSIYNDTANNCTTYNSSTALAITLPDLHAPNDFSGISSASLCATNQNGCIKVSWPNPTNGSWTDYRGFKVYSVDSNDNLTWLKDCVCTSNDCVNNHLNSCELTGLDIARTYDLYVRAYDAAGNITAAVSPYSQKRSSKSGDVVKPLFTAGLTVSYLESGMNVDWSQGSDNQVSNSIEAGNVVTYILYQKAGSTFSGASITAGNPALDGGAIKYEGPNSDTIISSGLNEGTTYYYTVCAKDSSNNVNCDGDIKSVLMPDITAPQLFGGITNVGLCATNADGCIKVTWDGPTNSDWTDYRGFRIYSVISSNNLSQEAECACTSNDCVSNPLNSCEITGLTPGKNYNFYVRAYDNATIPNLTTALNPWDNRRSGKSGDITPPTLISVLITGWQTGPANIHSSWNLAGDNQYGADNALRYDLYRKTGGGGFTLFAAGNNPPVDGNVVASSTANEYSDLATNLVQDTTYYYTVCAVDGANNTYCDGYVKSYVAPDVTAPTGWGGVQGASVCNVNADGCAKVSWNAPADWSDYAGFKLYTVDALNTLIPITTCPCSSNNCLANNKLSCEYTFPDHGRTKDFFVTAYDALGNETAPGLTPYNNRRTTKTGDVTKPSVATLVLSANYQANPAGNIVNWDTTTTTDLQYAEAGNDIRYKVYRRPNADFTFVNGVPTNADAELLTASPLSAATANFVDVQANLNAGTTYYYTACALDAANNMSCDTTHTKSVASTDTTPPDFNGATPNTATPIVARNQSYIINWGIHDNIAGNIQVDVRRKYANTQSDYPVLNDSVEPTLSGLNKVTLTDSYDPASDGLGTILKYVNYKITLTDASGVNSISSDISVKVAHTTITTADITNSVYHNTNMVIPTGSIVTFATQSQLQLASLTMQGTAQITHNVCSVATSTNADCSKVKLLVTGDVTMASGSTIDVSGKGYSDNRTNGNTGWFTGGNSWSWGGGGHGGYGYTSSNTSVNPNILTCTPYGNIKSPDEWGGGGYIYVNSGAYGGGIINLEIGGTLTVSGANIKADGLISSGGSPVGGAGGSIHINAHGAVTNAGGTFTLTAKGGSVASPSTGGGGGGGRIAFKYGSLSGFTLHSNLRLEAYGGLSGQWNNSAPSGTIYYTNYTSPGVTAPGHLRVDNNNQVMSVEYYPYTPLTLATDTTFDSTTVLNKAVLKQVTTTSIFNAGLLNLFSTSSSSLSIPNYVTSNDGTFGTWFTYTANNQGKNGGSSGGWRGGAGGGGASTVGSTCTASYVGVAGGAGLTSSIGMLATCPAGGTAPDCYYAGGGGGGGALGGAGGAGGAGGGGAGGYNNAVGNPGTSNTGGGGGGGYGSAYAGGAGGSGIVIVRYLSGTLSATGGAITTSGGYDIHTFTTTGTSIFEITSGIPQDVEYLVVAGGGGGGKNNYGGGGGGAGGVRNGTLTSLGIGSYQVIVGAGGASDANGVDSTFSTITALGGGRGGIGTTSGGSGGSGGGAGGGSGTTNIQGYGLNVILGTNLLEY